VSSSATLVHGSPPAGYRGPKRSLILAGGGMRVAYQAGVIRALIESGLCFAHADGTSGGTINLAMLFSGLSPDEMCRRWRTLDVKDFASLVPLHKYLNAFDMMAMGDADGIVGKVFPHLGVDVARVNTATGMSGTFNVCNYTRKTNEAVPHDIVDLDLLVAGISLPALMPPVERNGTLYVDSVWIKDANLLEAVARGSEELWLVWCIGNTPSYGRGLLNQYVHMIELSANGGLFAEFDRIKDTNARITRGEQVDGRTRPVVLHVIKPQYPLPLDPDYYFGRIDGATLIALGYRDAHRYLTSMRPEGIPFEPEATSMTDTPTGISFRETMSGPFALGATDPKDGAAKGEQVGTTLTMNASVLIRDLKAFVTDHEHPGELVGDITFPPLGEHLPATTGKFNLFSPSDDPNMRWMVYELAFERDGINYYLAGKKEVRDDPGLDLWADTTTLLTRLHKGTDASGPVVGAGVLRLGAVDLMKLLSTVTTPGADSISERAAAIGTFGKFFLGRLWDRYAHHVAS
jgi:predicted acylesterase/phospholipase RssA